jgi:hypothetical protein
MLTCSRVLLKRRVKEISINNYNPMILKMHRANIDLQFVLDPYACCVYIVDYIDKSDKGMTKVLEKKQVYIACLVEEINLSAKRRGGCVVIRVSESDPKLAQIRFWESRREFKEAYTRTNMSKNSKK